MFLLVLTASSAFAGMDPKAEGVGLYGDLWRPEPVHEYWDPGAYHRPETERVEGRFSGPECLECHQGLTPGIVNDWKASRHAAPSSGAAPVTCDACHGNDHQALTFPTPATCGTCHLQQHGAFLAERRYGFPSHALAMERAVDAKHFVDTSPRRKPPPACNAIRWPPSAIPATPGTVSTPPEARRPEACLTCHSGPPHPDDEAYFASAHGRRYRAEGKDWDWSKPLRKGNYTVPTCAYCHMQEGRHQVADKALWKFGLKEINPFTAENKIKRKRWIALCSECHDAAQAETWLKELNHERTRAWSVLEDAERVLRGLRSDDLLSPRPGERPPYPVDWWEKHWPRARIGFYEGQASAFYNVSAIERDYFEMWYFDNLLAYKGAAHGAPDMVTEGHRKLHDSLARLREQEKDLRALDLLERKSGKKYDPTPLWKHGPYTDRDAEGN